MHCLITAEILVQMSLPLTDNTSLLNIGCPKGMLLVTVHGQHGGVAG